MNRSKCLSTLNLSILFAAAVFRQSSKIAQTEIRWIL